MFSGNYCYHTVVGRSFAYTKPKPLIAAFFIARHVRAFSRLEHLVRKELIELVTAVIVMIATVIELVTKLL